MAWVSRMVDVQTTSVVIASAGVLIGAAYYVLEIRHQTRLRQTDLIMKLFSQFGSREYQESWQQIMNSEIKDYEGFVKKHGLANVWEVVMLFEGIGTLVHRRLVDISVVDDLISGPIKSTWEKMKPVIESYRKQSTQPQFCEWFEYLYNEMQKREQKLQQNGA
jgi:hypothetical protein